MLCFLTVVPAVHHQRVAKPLNNGALRLAEPLRCESERRFNDEFSLQLVEFQPSSRVRHVAGILLFHRNVVLQDMFNRSPHSKNQVIIVQIRHSMAIYERVENCKPGGTCQRQRHLRSSTCLCNINIKKCLWV